MEKIYAQLRISFLLLCFVVTGFFTRTQAQYCTPDHTAAGNCAGTDLITNVTLSGIGATLNNSVSACATTSRIFNFLGSSNATLYRDSLYNTYSLSVTSNTTSIISVWIDFNRDSIFSASEWWQVTTSSTANVANTINILVPTNAKIGLTRMRIRSRAAGNLNGDTSSCHLFGSGVAHDYKIMIDSLPACSSSPVAGSISTLDTACKSTTFRLGLSGNSIKAGQTFTWMASTDGTTWFTVATSYTPYLDVTANANVYVKCYTSCGGNTDSTAAKFIVTKFCYCSPTFSSGTSGGDYISRVILDSINNSTGPSSSPYYTYYSTKSTTLVNGSSYWLKIAPGTFTTNNDIAAFIDFNRDGAFDASEKLGQVNSVAALTLDSINFVVPANADSGLTRMRVVESYNTAAIDACGAYTYGEAEDYNIHIKWTSCTSNVGSVVTVDSVCKGNTLPLSLSVSSFGTASTFQWQYSLNNTTWNNYTTGTSTIFDTVIFSNTYVRCIMSCGTTGDTTNSKLVIAKNCYCTPAFTTGTSGGDYISMVSLDSINNSTGASASPYYTFYSNLSTTLRSGKSYVVKFTSGSWTSLNTIAVWIDYNRDGIFDTSEKLGQQDSLGAFALDSLNFTVPANTDTGMTRMRVIESYNTTNILPCGTYTFGETEDYTIYLKSFDCSKLNAGNIAAADSFCLNDTFTLALTAGAYGQGVTFQWQYSYNQTTWNNYSGATAASFDVAMQNSTYFRCIANCGSTSDTTPVKYIRVIFCYCSPTYVNGAGFGDYISSVKLDSINNNTGASSSPFYTKYNLSTTLKTGSSYYLKVTPGTWSGVGNNIAAWIDYDHSGTFDKATEKLGQVNNMAALTGDSILFMVPGTADTGWTILRVREAYNESDIDPCAQLNYGETEDYNIYIKYLACTTPPSAGTISQNTSMACTGDTIILKATGTSGGSGLTLQWQSSPDSITWSNIGGANSLNYGTHFSGTLYYRFKVTCSAQNGFSVPVKVTAKASNNCYCTALHSVSCSGLDLITNVKIYSTALDNTVSSCSGNSSYWSFAATGNTTANLHQGKTQQLEVTSNTNSIISVWIDYNQSGTFDSAEWTQITTSSTANVANSVYINIPSNAATGLTGMRIRSRVSGASNTYYDPCTTFGSGVTHDYLVNILPPQGLDMSILSMSAPSGIGCFSNAESVQLQLYNEGTDTVNFASKSLTIHTKVTGGTTTSLTDVVNSGKLAPGGSLSLTLSNTVDMSTQGTNYHFNIVITQSGDSNAFNDTLNVDVNSVQPLPLSYIENFETAASIPATYTASGFSRAAGQGVGGSASLRCSGNTAYTMAATPVVGPLTSKSALRFQYKTGVKLPGSDHMNISYSTDCGVTYTSFLLLDSSNTGNFGTYHAFQLPLGVYAGSNVLLKFERINNSGNSYSVDFDNVAVGNIPNPDLGGNHSNCYNYTLNVNRNGAACTIAWSTSTNNNMDTLTVFSSGTYSVIATADTTGILGYDTSVVSIDNGPSIKLGNDTAVCPGNQVIFGNTNWPAGYTYLWNTSDTTATIQTGTAGKYIYWVTNTSGCTSSDTVQLTINNLPAGVTIKQGSIFNGQFNAGSIAVPDQICTNNQVVYEVTPPSGYTNAQYNTKWTVTSVGIATAFGNTPSAATYTSTPPGAANGQMSFTPGTAEQDSTYMLWITIKDLITGCDTTVAHYIKVNAAPVVNLGSNQQICPGISYTFNAGTFNAYIWNTNSTASSVTVSIPGIYSVIITDSLGCKATDTVSLSNYTPVAVNLGADAKVCPGNSYTFSAGAFNAYLWNNGDTTSSISVNTPGSYNVMVTDTNGCNTSDTVKLLNYISPVVNLGADKKVCVGTPVTFNAGNFNSYQWNNGDTTKNILVSNTGIYIVTITDANGCTASDTVILDNFPAVVVNLGADPSICSGASVILDAGNALTHLWSTGAITQTLVVNTPGTYSVRNSDANGCYGYDTVIVKSGAVPNSAFSYNRVDANAKVQFTAADQSLSTYNWDFGDGNSSSLASPLHLYTNNGSYTVKLSVVNAAGCTDNSSQVIFINTGFNNIENITSDIKVVPNPYEGETHLLYTLKQGGQVNIELYDLVGKKISTLHQGQQTSGAYTLPVNTQQFNAAQGIYIVRLAVDGEMMNLKIVDLNTK